MLPNHRKGLILLTQNNQILDLFKNKDEIALSIYEQDLKNRDYISKMKDKYIQDTLFSIRFLASSVSVDDPLVFQNYMKWFGGLAYQLNFNLESMDLHFKATLEVFKKTFDSSLYDLISNYYLLGIESFKTAYNEENNQKRIDIDQFLEYLISMKSDEAYQYIINKVEEGKDLKEIYLDIIQPTMYKVGELWKRQIISVAKEHYITAVIQHIIGKLYSILFTNRNKYRHSMTAVCAGDELHEIGMRMVADFFELSGWDSVFLGSNIPSEMIIEQLLEKKTDLIAISATTPAHLVEVKELIHTIKTNPILKNTKIIVGGRVFNEAPNIWKNIGADGFANDAEQAVLLGNLLVGGE